MTADSLPAAAPVAAPLMLIFGMNIRKALGLSSLVG